MPAFVEHEWWQISRVMETHERLVMTFHRFFSFFQSALSATVDDFMKKYESHWNSDCVGQTRNVEAIHVYTWTIWKHSRAFEYDIAANKIMMIATTVYATEVGRTLQVDSINGTESLSRNQVRT